MNREGVVDLWLRVLGWLLSLFLDLSYHISNLNWSFQISVSANGGFRVYS